jgi:thymidylate kinase
LEDEGMEVTMTRWNASPLMAETIKNAKKRKQLTPVTFTMMQAADLAEQINTIIRPALAVFLSLFSFSFLFFSFSLFSLPFFLCCETFSV